MLLYELKAQDIYGEVVDFGQYLGKVLLIVNTATGCGFTPQYTGLQALYDKYNEFGFEVLDFPCNQFGQQAPGTGQEIASFCQSHFGVTFKQFAKIEVNGKNEHPLYTYLKSKKHGVFGKDIKWNFTKFLVDRDGTVLKRYAPEVTPDKIDLDIYKLLTKDED